MDVLPTVETKILAVSFGAKANPEERVLAVAAEDGQYWRVGGDPFYGTPAALSVMHIATTGVFRLEDRRKTEMVELGQRIPGGWGCADAKRPDPPAGGSGPGHR